MPGNVIGHELRNEIIAVRSREESGIIAKA
jgi:hypothetical protein